MSHSEKCDIFSLGVVMWEFCSLNRPWEGVPPVQVSHVSIYILLTIYASLFIVEKKTKWDLKGFCVPFRWQVVNAVANEESRLEIPPPAVASWCQVLYCTQSWHFQVISSVSCIYADISLRYCYRLLGRIQQMAKLPRYPHSLARLWVCPLLIWPLISCMYRNYGETNHSLPAWVLN